MKKALIIFVRNPEQGKVKTRLAATIGDEAALYIYNCLLHHTLMISRQTDCDKFVFYADTISANDMWSEEHYYKLLQADADLGEKMKAAFSQVFQKAYDKVVIIGSDCPQLEKEHLDIAFEQLNTYDVVIGPANDGGYYLLGMKAIHPQLFEGKAWSTGTVFEDTMHSAQSLSLSISVLQTLTDVDEEKDLPESWKEEIKALFDLA